MKTLTGAVLAAALLAGAAAHAYPAPELQEDYFKATALMRTVGHEK